MFYFPLSDRCPVCGKVLKFKPIDPWWGDGIELTCVMDNDPGYHFYASIEDGQIEQTNFITNKFIIQNIFVSLGYGTEIRMNDPQSKILYWKEIIWIADPSQPNILEEKIETLLLLQ